MTSLSKYFPKPLSLKSFPDISLSFDSYLDSDSSAPLGVAVSGGGDSLALLCLLHRWNKRRLHVFSVDHGLNPHSADWCAQVEDFTKTIGANFTKLDWTGDKPQTGLQAAARQARHRLLAEAARARGIRVLCLGHTADDVHEASHMRGLGSNVGTPAIWSPSPVWPEGRGVFIYRPLLNVSRQALRDWLNHIGVSWIDDPANDNPNYLRTRARQALANAVKIEIEVDRNFSIDIDRLLPQPQPYAAYGISSLNADYVLNLAEPLALKVIAAAMVTAGGGDKLPRSHSLKAIYKSLKQGQGGPFTLTGARLTLNDQSLLIGREPGDMVRSNLQPLSIAPRTTAMWDGRFEITARDEPIEIFSAHGLKSALSPSDLARFLLIPNGYRASLPVVKTSGRLVLLPESHNKSTGLSTSWIRARFLGAVGVIANERDIDQNHSKV